MPKADVESLSRAKRFGPYDPVERHSASFLLLNPPSAGAHDAASPEEPRASRRSKAKVDYADLEGGYLSENVSEDDLLPYTTPGSETRAPMVPKEKTAGTHSWKASHMKQWCPDEDQRLVEAVEASGATLRWTNIAEYVGGGRTPSMCRNRLQRMNASSHRGGRKEGINKCTRCGSIKRGHTCTALAPAAPERERERERPTAPASPLATALVKPQAAPPACEALEASAWTSADPLSRDTLAFRRLERPKGARRVETGFLDEYSELTEFEGDFTSRPYTPAPTGRAGASGRLTPAEPAPDADEAEPWVSARHVTEGMSHGKAYAALAALGHGAADGSMMAPPPLLRSASGFTPLGISWPSSLEAWKPMFDEASSSAAAVVGDRPPPLLAGSSFSDLDVDLEASVDKWLQFPALEVA